MSSNKVKISIIIPVYNCFSYLEKCLNSAISQTLKEIEIICIDDGSSDGSEDILKRYEEKYEFIHVFSQKNSGAGAARNLGLYHAAGEYIAFLDADDFYLDTDALEKMYQTCKEKRVSICGSYGKFIEGDKLKEADFYDTTQMIPGIVYPYKEFQMDYGYYTFIYKKQLLTENNLSFPLYRRFQDPPFMVKAMYYGKQFAMADTALYCYRLPSLATRLNQDKVIDLLKGIRDNLNFAGEHQLEKLFYNTLRRLEYEYCYMILNNICANGSEKNDNILRLLFSINNLVQIYKNDKNYILHTLQMMMQQAAFYNQNYQELLKQKIDSMQYIAVYGAGKYAKNFFKFLKKNRYVEKVSYVVVSDKKGNEEQIEGIEVVDLDTFLKENKKECVFVAVGAVFHNEIANGLKKKGYYNYELLNDAFLGSI